MPRLTLPSRLRWFSVCLGLFLFCTTSSLHARGSEDNFCKIDISKQGDNAPEYFRVVNKTHGFLTVTFSLPKAENVVTQPALPKTWVLRARETADLFSVHPKNARQAWRYEYRYDWRQGNVQARHDDAFRYRLPYEKGRTFKVIQGFHGRFSHTGEYAYAIDWDMPEGTPICAARGGTVIRVEQEFTGRGLTPDFKDRTNAVLIQHEDGTIGQYSHIRFRGSAVHVGQVVRTGQVIAYSGDVGYSGGYHLHFSVLKPVSGKSLESVPIVFTDGRDTLQELREQHSYTAR